MTAFWLDEDEGCVLRLVTDGPQDAPVMLAPGDTVRLVIDRHEGMRPYTLCVTVREDETDA